MISNFHFGKPTAHKTNPLHFNEPNVCIACGLPDCRHIVCSKDALSLPRRLAALLSLSVRIPNRTNNKYFRLAYIRIEHIVCLIKWIVRSGPFWLRSHAQSSKVELLNFAKILIKRQCSQQCRHVYRVRVPMRSIAHDSTQVPTYYELCDRVWAMAVLEEGGQQ